MSRYYHTNYCECGEYLKPQQEYCDDPKFGCHKKRPSLICAKEHYISPECKDFFQECPACGAPSIDRYFKEIDWKSLDRNYWKKIFTDHPCMFKDGKPPYFGVPCLGPPFFGIKEFRNKILQTRYEHRRPKQVRGFDPVDDYGKEVGNWLNSCFDDLSYGHYCVDNFRFAQANKAGDRKRYKKKRAKGCCGSFDTYISDPIYGKFMIGFNYGH